MVNRNIWILVYFVKIQVSFASCDYVKIILEATKDNDASDFHRSPFMGK